ncbi:MAG: PAS domain S-box protein [Planctomycetes bacterium]|nr:PAS domain S-box protein [Planctomycetota bacterium]
MNPRRPVIDQELPDTSATNGLACLVAPQGDILWVNELWQRSCQHRGLPRATFAEGANYLAACGDGDPDGHRFAERLRRLLRGDSEFFAYEYACTPPGDAEAQTFIAHAQAIRLDGHRCAFVVHVDVSTERRVIEALSTAEQRYRQLFDAAPDAAFLLVGDGDDVGRILDANQAAADQHGYARNQLIGMSIGELDAPQERHLVRERIARLREHGHVSFTVQHLRRDGTTFPVDVSARMATIDGRPCVVTFNRDATQREHFVSELHEQQVRLDLAMRASQVGFWDWNIAEDRVYFSPEWKAQLGYAPDEIVDDFDAWRSRLHPDDVAPTMAALDAHLTGEASAYVVEFRLRHRDGTYRWIYVRGEAQRDPEGRAVRLVGCHVDITAQKEAAAEHVELQRRLDQLQRVDVIGTLAGGIAHDFNNVLTIITGNLDLAMLDDTLSPAVREGLVEARKASERARALTRQVLTFSRNAPTAREPLDLAQTVGEAARLLRLAVPRSIELRTTIAQHVPPVVADAGQLEQVLVNLGTNAWHAIGDGPGHIDVELLHDTDDDSAVLIVRDDGAGMDTETQARAFEPMFTTKPAGQGTGFGLSVVHNIVKRHGGTITCSSAPGQGTTFTVRLPIDRSAEAPPASAPTAPGARRGRLLLLDDEPKLLAVLARGLDRLGHRVTMCDSAARALELVRRGPAFDAVVTDYGMPGMRGDAFVAAVRREQPDLPVVLCSGYLSEDALQRVEAAGASMVLLKPVLAADLDRELQLLLPAAT